MGKQTVWIRVRVNLLGWVVAIREAVFTNQQMQLQQCAVVAVLLSRVEPMRAFVVCLQDSCGKSASATLVSQTAC
jgi:hypothetical protein